MDWNKASESDTMSEAAFRRKHNGSKASDRIAEAALRSKYLIY